MFTRKQSMLQTRKWRTARRGRRWESGENMGQVENGDATQARSLTISTPRPMNLDSLVILGIGTGSHSDSSCNLRLATDECLPHLAARVVPSTASQVPRSRATFRAVPLFSRSSLHCSSWHFIYPNKQVGTAVWTSRYPHSKPSALSSASPVAA